MTGPSTRNLHGWLCWRKVTARYRVTPTINCSAQVQHTFLDVQRHYGGSPRVDWEEREMTRRQDYWLCWPFMSSFGVESSWSVANVSGRVLIWCNCWAEWDVHLYDASFLSRLPENLVDVFRDRWIIYPTNALEAADNLAVYSRLGFPGAIGSVDCTHVYWDRCPALFQNTFSGKE